jgi:hypothetical protein
MPGQRQRSDITVCDGTVKDARAGGGLMRLAGIEPATLRSGGARSIP